MKAVIATVVFAVLVLTTLYVLPSLSESKACRPFKDDMSHYAELRRKGGSLREMEEWKRRYREAQDAYRSCLRGEDGPERAISR